MICMANTYKADTYVQKKDFLPFITSDVELSYK